MVGLKVLTRCSKILSAIDLSPQVKTSNAAYPDSGQVWMDKWDSAITTTPETPWGENLWKEWLM